jgi:negative regulator of flagellin synthesis FlgM
MTINSEQLLASVNKLTNSSVEKNEAAAVAGNKGSAKGSDRIELSTNSKDIEQLKKALKVALDLGSDKVAQLKEQLSAGTYKVDGKAVSAKMLQNWSELNSK